MKDVEEHIVIVKNRRGLVSVNNRPAANEGLTTPDLDEIQHFIERFFIQQ